MPYSSAPFCSDEQVLTRMGPADYFACQRVRGRLVQGSDGVIAGWDLSSPSVALGTLGLAAGMMGRVRTAPTPPAGNNDLGWVVVAVEAVTPDGLTLRYEGEEASVGLPVGAVVVAPVAFEFATTAGVIGQVSRKIRAGLQLADDLQLVSADDPEAAAVAMSCAWLYFAASREATGGDRDTYWTKYLDLKKEADLAWEALKERQPDVAGEVSGGEVVVVDLTAGCGFERYHAACHCPPGATAWRDWR